MMNSRISLYIPCYNVEKYIASCIDAVLAQTRKADEIIIIDDGSRDRTLEIASAYPVKIIKHDMNKGLAAARNTAIKASTGEFIASLDADCIAAPEWLESLLKTMEDPSVAAAGGCLRETVIKNAADKWRHLHMQQSWGDKRIFDAPFLFGNNTLIRRSVFNEKCSYNEALRTNGEDIDISGKIREQGMKIVYEPAAKVDHLREDTLYSIVRTSWRYSYSGPGSLIYDRRLRKCLAFIYYASLNDLKRLLFDFIRLKPVSVVWVDICITVYKLWMLLRVALKLEK